MNKELIISILMDSIMLFFLSIAFFIALDILKNWNYKEVALKQAKLQKRVYLSSVILSYVITLKIVLFFLFLYTLDELSNVITGAMCSVGVLSNTQVGNPLLIVKGLIIILFALWLLLFKINQDDKTLQYTKKLYGFFVPIYILVLLEFTLLLTMAMTLDVDKIVSCCSTLFAVGTKGNSSQTFFKFDEKILFFSFISLYFLSFYHNKYFTAIIGIAFFTVGIINITSFFSPYIYELPHHRCPFCILQKEYYYIGFFIYLLMAISLYSSIANLFLKLLINKEIPKYYKNSSIVNTIIMLILFFYVAKYYYLNGVSL